MQFLVRFFNRLRHVLIWGILGIIALASALFMFTASHGDAPIVDEQPHIAAGYSYLRYFDARLNPEHPPLVKMLAGFPLLFQGLNFPVAGDAWRNGINEQWTLGSDFLYDSGNNPDAVVGWARLGPMLLTLILIIAVYAWSKELLGRWWALLPSFLIAFSPTFLAHGHYVTTDVGATLGIFLATAAFLNFLFSPSRKHLIWAGLAFGLAQLVKFSAFLLVPYFILLMTVFYAVSVARDWKMTDPQRGRLRRFAMRFWKYFRSLFIIFLIGFAMVYIVYFFLVWNYPRDKQVADTGAILASFSPRTLPAVTLWLANVPVLRPIAQYLLGLLMVLQRSSGGNTIYFLGNVSGGGSPLYFPLVFLMKEPVASLIMIFFAIGYSIYGLVRSSASAIARRSFRIAEYLTTNFAEFALLLFVGIYWTSSVSSHLNIGIRHILPTLPFIYILTAGAIKRWFSIKNLDAVQNFALKIFIVYRELISVSLKSAALVVLIVWYVLSACVTAPYFLSYFNFLAGGTHYGYQYVTDSNYDWGQDLRRLASWADQNLPPGEKIAVDYFGGGRPGYHLGNREVDWWSSKGSPANENIRWLAVSINTIQQAKGTLAPDQPRKPEDEYRWLTDPYHPFARAGTSIFIYKLQ